MTNHVCSNIEVPYQGPSKTTNAISHVIELLCIWWFHFLWIRFGMIALSHQLTEMIGPECLTSLTFEQHHPHQNYSPPQTLLWLVPHTANQDPIPNCHKAINQWW